MALLTPNQAAILKGSIPYQFQKFISPAPGALTDVILIDPASIPASPSAWTLVITSIALYGTNTVEWYFEDAAGLGGVAQWSGKGTGGAARTIGDSAGLAPIIVCSPGKGLYVSTSSDPGVYDITMTAYVVPPG